MDFQLKTFDSAAASAEKTDALLVLVPETALPDSSAVGKVVASARKSGDLDCAAGKLLSLYRAEGIASPRLILAGAGSGNVAAVQKAVAAALGALKSNKRVKRITVLLPQSGEGRVRGAVLAASHALYAYTTTKPSADASHVTRVTVGVPSAAADREDFAWATAAASGITFAKEWGNRPANLATPTRLGEAAKTLAKSPKFRCEVLGPREIGKLGMGALQAVAQGSAEEARFIVLRYDGGARNAAPVVLVGKGITFDSGGISIKPAAEMDEMKFDMCGAASVLGVFHGLAELRPSINVVGLIPSCENMPGSRALKPGDVITSMAGQTIEVLNTDAEGRLVLCDAICYAERFSPRAVIDIATLTGACVVALGHVRSGLFSDDDALATALAQAGDASLDPCWRMPLDDEYAEGLKSNFADVANVAGRAGGAVTAAKFLQRFAKSFPWAHLDIAGSAWKSGSAKGSTGRPVGLLLEYLENQSRLTQPAIKNVVKVMRPAAVKAAVPVPGRRVRSA
jgi:leucyl aminopeptidase